MKTVITSFVFVGLLWGQAPNPTQTTNQTVTQESQPLYRVTVVSRNTQAVNYRHRGGATKINFQGTALMPRARGEAKVESKQGYIEVEVEFDDVEQPAKYGAEYLTYVLWAISPEGRATNLGEIILNGTKSKLNVTTELQSFGMIVTAEPYFSVSQPSDVVVMENVIRRDTLGKTDVIDAKYELLQRGSYVFQAGKSNVTRDSKVPLELNEARNAIQIARWTGAEKYASDVFAKAADALRRAEDYQARKQKKPMAGTAREAAQTAEDARLITLKRIDEERLANERRMAAEREAAERAKAAESERQNQLEAARRAQAEADAQRANAERAAAEVAKASAIAERQAAERAKAEAEAARQAALAQQQAAQQAAEQARLMAEQQTKLADASRQAALTAEQEKEALRKQLLDQFNMILETRDTARGLIVNMSDVLFDTGKYTLRPIAREKLARVGGIVLSHPGLKIEVEGHTDSVGGDAYNQRLSEQRADAVLQYLVSQGLRPDILTARGFGKTMPVASNETAAGRHQNRRVELVVSGEVIGTKLSDMRGTVKPTQP